jgi:hypothetical protein
VPAEELFNISNPATICRLGQVVTDLSENVFAHDVLWALYLRNVIVRVREFIEVVGATGLPGSAEACSEMRAVWAADRISGEDDEEY